MQGAGLVPVRKLCAARMFKTADGHKDRALHVGHCPTIFTKKQLLMKK